MSLTEAQERHRNIGRNDECPCGSGKKYKKCHKAEDDALISADLTRAVDEATAKAEAEAEAEAEADKADARKGTGKKAAAPVAQKRNKPEAHGSARASKGEKSQSLPRRGAV